MILRANCKINLGLDILRRRADGYHDLETVMSPVRGLYDEVEVVRMAGAGVDFRAEGLAVDCEPEQNICIKAFRLMHDRYGGRRAAPGGAAVRPTARRFCWLSTGFSTCTCPKRS